MNAATMLRAAIAAAVGAMLFATLANAEPQLLPTDASAAEPAAQPTAEHDTASQARIFFEIGAQAYEQGDYRAALEAFHEAYARAKRPGLLFSMAQAHRRAFFTSADRTELARAIEHYRKYLASADTARRRDAEEALSKLVPLAGPGAPEAATSSTASGAAKLMIASSTPGAVLRVDGTPAARLPYVAAVTPGTHRLELSAPGFREHVRELPVPAGTAFALEISLEELPGTLAVAGQAGSQLWVDGRLVGALPLPPLSLKAGPHQLSLRRPGHRIATRKLTVERGAAARVELAVVPSTQRKASIGLLWGGAATALAGAATAIAAYARQRTAARLHERREESEISASQLQRYNDALAARDRLGRAAITLGSAGVVSLLLGAALFGFERPELPALLQPDQDAGAPADKQAPAELIGGPAWDGERLGVEVRGRF